MSERMQAARKNRAAARALTDKQKLKHAYGVHQDSLLWSRVQTLIAIQGATIGGTYYSRQYLYGPMLVAWLGVVLTGLLWIIAERDQIHREQSRKESGVPATDIDRLVRPCLRWK